MGSQADKGMKSRLSANSMYLAILFLIGTSILIYSHSLDHRFLTSWDDNVYVLKNPDVRGFSLDHIHAAFTKFYVGNYAPLHIVSYMLDYTLWGLNPAGYIGLNILLHTTNGLLLYWLVYKLSADKAVAFFSSLIFLVHPVQVESVVWISQRKNVLAMFFFLSSFLSYIYYRAAEDSRRVAFYAIALVAFCCALLSKSVTVVLPVVLVLYDVCFAPRKKGAQWGVDKIPFVIATAAMVVMTLKSQAASAGGGIVEYPADSAFDIVITMLTVFARYTGMLLWPARLSSFYDISIKTAVDLSVVLSAILMLVLAAGLFWLFRKDKALFFWGALIPIGIVPVSQIIPLSTLMNDRYLYFPLLGFAVLLTSGLLYCLALLPPPMKSLQIALICLILLPLPVLAWQRSEVWYDSISLWSDAAEKYPGFTTYAGLGNALSKAERFDEAIETYQQSLQLEPTCEEALRGLGTIYLNRGQYGKALQYINRFVQNYPDDAFGQQLLATAYQQLKMQKR